MEIRFPNPQDADENGIVALSDGLNTALLRAAYRQGIFPWPVSHWDAIPWFCPHTRAVLDFERLNIPRSLRKVRRKSDLRFTFDHAFPQVIQSCSRAPRPGQESTWILPSVVEAYCALHLEGHAHSVEAWRGPYLVGGLYGVDAGGVFAGESMFYLEPNASKLALLFLVEHLQKRGATWLDAQVMTPHLQMLGAKEISRAAFLEKLTATQSLNLQLFG
jgi:leucyl/phenylalanyl-tRNA--protein transferase